MINNRLYYIDKHRFIYIYIIINTFCNIFSIIYQLLTY